MKQKIAVLGGGAASLSAVFELTNVKGWADQYEITVYQLGWRLGGKGATGRDPAKGNRIQEHGLHLWFGFYDNAFKMMREVYRELNRPATVPISTFEQAFLPHNFFTMQQQFKGQWHAWDLPLPSNPSRPGVGSEFPPPWDYLIEAFEVLWSLWGAHRATVGVLEKLAGIPVSLAAAAVLRMISFTFSRVRQQLDGLRTGHAMGGLATSLLAKLLRLGLNLIRRAMGSSVHQDLDSYRAWISIDAIGTMLVGVLADEVITRGPDAVNDINFNDWVKKHGGSPELLDSCLIQSAYDSSFALFHWSNNPQMETGTILRGAARMFLMYKGSITWRFAAGTGDSVFAPLYQVLRQRGVKFEFFHEVTQLVAPASGPMEVTEIQFNRQAQLKVPEYDPLVTVNGLPCWPSEPGYAQLVEGAQLKQQQIDLESFWTPWKGGTTRVLKKGVDFDHVICGLSLDPLRFVAKQLTARSDRWKRMLKSLQTNRTQAFQLWLNQDLKSLGWDHGPSLLSTFGEPLDTWADLSITLPYETWPAGHEPKIVGYFCGSMTDSAFDYPPRTDTGYPAKEQALAKQEALSFINDKLQFLWPKAFVLDPGTQKQVFRWELLVDPLNRVGPARLDSQWWRANVDPSERYVLSLTGSSKHRLPPGDTDFKNLTLVGDYTECGLNAGCMEGAIISGAMGARAICGAPAHIPGEGSGLFS